MLSLADRRDAYNQAFAKWPASHLRIVEEQDRDVLYGRWGETDAREALLREAFLAGYNASTHVSGHYQEARAFELWLQDHPMSHEELDGVWLVGANYGNTSDYHGAYPRGYVERVLTLFPDVVGAWDLFGGAPIILHACAGSIDPDPRWARLDVKAEPVKGNPVELVGSVEHVRALTDVTYGEDHFFGLTMVDVPYTDLDAKKYGTDPVNRGKASAALADVVAPGGFMVWLDLCWPMHNKEQWLTVGRITLLRSTNHLGRFVSIFQRAEEATVDE